LQGHIFPLIARPGGVRQRRGHTETGVDLCRLTNLAQVGVLAEIQNDDGTMARLPSCAALGKQHNIPLITVEQLVRYLNEIDSPLQQTNSTPSSVLYPTHVNEVASCTLPIQRNGEFLGKWDMRCFHSAYDGQVHVVLVKVHLVLAQWSDHPPTHNSFGLFQGTLDTTAPVAVRVHSECFTGNTLGSLRCDCEDQLFQSLQIINERGSGLIIYMGGHEGRGIGLVNKIKAYQLQETKGLDTYAANETLGYVRDARKYDTAIAIIRKFGITQVDLLSNNPIKASTLDNLVVRVTPVVSAHTEYNHDYLQSKRLEEASLAKVLFSTPLNNKFQLHHS